MTMSYEGFEGKYTPLKSYALFSDFPNATEISMSAVSEGRRPLDSLT